MLSLKNSLIRWIFRSICLLPLETDAFLVNGISSVLSEFIWVGGSSGSSVIGLWCDYCVPKVVFEATMSVSLNVTQQYIRHLQSSEQSMPGVWIAKTRVHCWRWWKFLLKTFLIHDCHPSQNWLKLSLKCVRKTRIELLVCESLKYTYPPALPRSDDAMTDRANTLTK